jgi:hypothetical protein
MTQAFAERNVLICAVMGVLLVRIVVCWAFMPLYLTQVRGFDAQTMGWLMGTLGISATVGAFWSRVSGPDRPPPAHDRVPLIGVICHWARCTDGFVWVPRHLLPRLGLNGIFPLFMATVPWSVDRRHIATVLGVCMGTGEIIGGVLSPSIAGFAADLAGLQAPLWIMLGLAVAGGLLALGLRETAPRIGRHHASLFADSDLGILPIPALSLVLAPIDSARWLATVAAQQGRPDAGQAGGAPRRSSMIRATTRAEPRLCDCISACCGAAVWGVMVISACSRRTARLAGAPTSISWLTYSAYARTTPSA